MGTEMESTRSTTSVKTTTTSTTTTTTTSTTTTQKTTTTSSTITTTSTTSTSIATKTTTTRPSTTEEYGGFTETTTSSTTTTKKTTTTTSSTTTTTSTTSTTNTTTKAEQNSSTTPRSKLTSTSEMNISLLEYIQLKMPKPTDRLCPTCKSSSSLAACFRKQQICSPNQVCDIELRSRSGKIETITMGCKQKYACNMQINQNDDQCRPYSKRGPSVCRTCCSGNKCFTTLAELSEKKFRPRLWNWAKLF